MHPHSPLDEFLPHLGPRRDALVAFEAWVAANTAWHTAPASTRFHLNRAGGLVDHCRDVLLFASRVGVSPSRSPRDTRQLGLFPAG
jgi:hypothetical protein